MPEIAMMVEGQDGVNWDVWERTVRTVEEAGFHGLFRSDHFTPPAGPVKDSLEAWVSLAWLADNTDTLEFGPLVTPISFRDPVFTARMAKDVDNLSDGRLTLGMGAGWQEREHETFGYDLLDMTSRFDRLGEGLEVVTGLLQEEDPVSFDGAYYELEDAQLLPRPERPTPLLVGGNGRKRTMPLAAEYADEWNGVFLPPEDYAERNERLDELLVEAGRDPGDVTRSLMTAVVFGRDETEVDRLVEAHPMIEADSTDEIDPEEHPVVVGTGDEIAAQLEQLETAGADRVMLQWLDLDDLERMEAMADAILG